MRRYTSDYRFKIGDFAQGSVDRKFQIGVAPPTNHSFSQKTRLNDLSCGVKIWTDFSSVLSQFTRLTDRHSDRRRDRQTDGQAEFSSLDRVCIPCSAVKTATSSPSNKHIFRCTRTMPNRPYYFITHSQIKH